MFCFKFLFCNFMIAQCEWLYVSTVIWPFTFRLNHTYLIIIIKHLAWIHVPSPLVAPSLKGCAVGIFCKGYLCSLLTLTAGEGVKVLLPSNRGRRRRTWIISHWKHPFKKRSPGLPRSFQDRALFNDFQGDMKPEMPELKGCLMSTLK